jgi:hypothetical protein
MKGRMRLREKERAPVGMVADEVFCWLPTMSASRGIPLLRVSPSNTRCLLQSLEQRDALCSKTNTQMRSGLTRLSIRSSPEQSQLL